MTNKVFAFAGIVNYHGRDKIHWSNDLSRRVKQANKRACARVDFMVLPRPMTKVEALHYLQGLAEFQSPADQALIADTLANREKPARNTVKVTNRPSVDSIQSRDSTDETVA